MCQVDAETISPSAGIFRAASCTLFSPKCLTPAWKASMTRSGWTVLVTATMVTSAADRPALRQASAMRCRSSNRLARTSVSDNYVYQLARHVNHAAHLFVVQVHPHLFAAQRKFTRFSLCQRNRRRHTVPQLSVHLHHQRDFVLARQALVPGRPLPVMHAES